jgi:hypothetical protein
MEITREKIEYVRTTETIDITIPYYYKILNQNGLIVYGKVYSEDLQSIEISERKKLSPTENSFQYDYCLNASLKLTADHPNFREHYASKQKDFDDAKNRMTKYAISVLEND